VDEIQSLWKDQESFRVKSRYGSIIESKKFIDKIRFYSKKKHVNIGELASKRIERNIQFDTEIKWGQSGSSGGDI